MPPIKTLFLETRPQYLLLSILLVTLGASLARYYGGFQWLDFYLCLAGLILLHISVNVLNDYYDYSSGIDLETQITPFNGGSGLLNQGLLSPRQAMVFGVSAFALAVPIGGYFLVKIGFGLLPLLLLGAVFVIFGTSHITQLGYGLGELSAGLGLGALPVFGTAWILTGNPSAKFIAAAVPSALWVFNLLFLNEFPDAEADKRGGRKTLAIQLGFKNSHSIYIAINIIAYFWIIGATIAGIMPLVSLIALVSSPLAYQAIKLSAKPDYGGDFLKAQAANVGLVLSGHFLLAAAYVWAGF